MPVDNAIYDTEPWRDEHRLLYTLHALTPPRFAYLHDTLTGTLGLDLAGKRALDVGCGGGYLAEEFAKAGCAVTGIDPSGPTIRQAEEHACEAGLHITWRIAPGEAIPFDDNEFDIVYCCDVLEHVNDLDRVIAESARVLKPGGVYLFDTINRTLASRLVVIGIFQEWEPTRFMTTNFHDAAMFIRPRELRKTLAQHGLEPQETVGLNPRGNPLRALQGLRQVKHGAITFAQLGDYMPLQVSKRMPILYAGYAIRAGVAPS
jgi:2-polyprenyl-6-hydroxyphenyl methylase/3-demethylubiquinone-9 3-methyltransferase